MNYEASHQMDKRLFQFAHNFIDYQYFHFAFLIKEKPAPTICSHLASYSHALYS